MTSTIKVDNIQNQCGANIINESSNTITIGASGDTVTLASGASQTGFGRTGTVDWQTGSIKTATFTAANGEGYFANTSGGAFTMNLPAGTAGNIVSVVDYTNTFQTNGLTISANGSQKIGGGDGGEPLTLSTEGQGLTLVYIDSTVGWRSIHSDDFAQVPASATYITATGGTITTSGDFKIHTFTGPGTFTVCSVGNPAGSDTVDYLVVAGAGAGGGNNPSAFVDGSGGGGAGGARMSSGAASGCYAASPLGACVSALPVSAQGYPITVGGGGSTNSGACGTSNGNPGNNSVFSTVTSAGGGGGATHAFSTNPQKNGSNGGSGGGPGGGFTCTSSFGTGNTPPVSPPQGQNSGIANSAPDHSGAGGGGAGGAGTPGGPGCSRAGDGGIGITNAITGSNVVYAGGGGGASGPPTGLAGGFGGINPGGSGPAPQADRGGAGNGVTPGCGTAGTANTGGGGGGGAKGNTGTSVGGAGGSGVVIIRYKFQ